MLNFRAILDDLHEGYTVTLSNRDGYICRVTFSNHSEKPYHADITGPRKSRFTRDFVSSESLEDYLTDAEYSVVASD